MYREQGDAVQSAANQWILGKSPKPIETYLPDDVFNVDKTDLYFHAFPEHICSRTRVQKYAKLRKKV